jgi:hypothetical protein
MAFESARQYIESIELSMIENNMATRQGWSANEAKQAGQLYRNYLILRCKYPEENLPPSKEVDEVWHNHILDTKKYREDCEAIFGRFFDHYPYFGMDETSTQEDLERAFQRMQQLHTEEFGYPVRRVRYPWYLRWLSAGVLKPERN